MSSEKQIDEAKTIECDLCSKLVDPDTTEKCEWCSLTVCEDCQRDHYGYLACESCAEHRFYYSNGRQ